LQRGDFAPGSGVCQWPYRPDQLIDLFERVELANLAKRVDPADTVRF
jgi:hypothetical protein